MFEDKACKRNYENGDVHFAAGMKVMTVKYNRRVEQHGPTDINQPKKWRHHAQHGRKINVHSKSTSV
jgi:hypothetical protein